MGLPTNDNAKGKGNNKNQKSGNNNSKFIVKPSSTKGAGMAQKPKKTGGTRGS